MKDYMVTLGDLMCPGGGPECELSVSLQEEPDRGDLEAALQMLLRRFPFLSSEIYFPEGHMQLKPSRRPFPPVGQCSAPLGSEEQNGYGIGLFCRGNEIVFRFLHSIMDGRGGLKVLKTLLHCYLLLHYGEDLRCEDLLLPEEAPLEEEYADPFSFAAKPQKPLKVLTPPDAFAIPEEDLDFTGDIANYILHIPRDSFLQFLHSQDQSPASFLILMLCRAMDSVYPQHEKPIVIHSPADIRRLLGCEQTMQYCISSLWFTYDDRVRKMPRELQMICFRGMLLRQTYPDYVMQELCRMKDLYTENIRRRLQGEDLYVPWSRMPYMLTYVGNTDFGEMGKYVRPLTIANTAPVPLLCSVTEAEGVFRLSLELQTKTPAILEAFLRELDMAGISYTRQPALYLPRP